MSKRLDKLTAMRPQTANPDAPAYAPERDVAMLGAGMIEDMRLAFLTGRFERWQPYLASLIKLPDGLSPEEQKERLTEEVNEAGQRFAAWVRASLLRDGSLTMADQQKTMGTDFRQAFQDFLTGDEGASLFVSAMLGYMFMDRLFFFTRQAMLFGESTPLPTNDFMSLVSRIGNGWRTGETDADICARELRLAVELLLSAGYSGNQIREMVDTAIAKCMSSRM